MKRHTWILLMCLISLATSQGIPALASPPSATQLPNSLLPAEPNSLLPAERALLSPEAAKRAERYIQPVNQKVGWIPNRPDPRLRVAVSVESKTLVEGQPLILQIELHNPSSTVIRVNTQPPVGGFQARLFDASGKVYWGGITPITSFGRTLPTNGEHFARIEAGETLKLALPVRTIRDFDQPQSHVWQTLFPGSFVLTLTFRSNSASWHALDTHNRTVEHAVPNAWTGGIVSNTIGIELSPTPTSPSSTGPK